ncbi:MAG TPA: alpha/beta hydrolase [Sphingomicrobium sp.]|nr:alpha/beta hydrolase [Sphingomicrobium sp.]
MNRAKLAAALLAAVFTTLSVTGVAKAGSAREEMIDQGSWNASKKFVHLGNGLRVAYVETGNPAGKPLLLLHGFTDTSRSWSLAVPHLAKYRLLIPDLRGHGATDAPECCYGPVQLADDARLFLDAVAVEKAAVAGHSGGSMAAMALAAEHPGRVTHLVLVGSTGLAPLQRGDWLIDNVERMTFPIDRNSQFMRDWHPANQPNPIDPAFAAAAMEEILAVKPHVWRGFLRELVGLPVARHAADVKAKVLILSGEKDPLFPVKHHAALVTAFPGAQAHIFAGLGHNLNWERPAQVAATIDAFVSSASSVATTSRQ